MKSQLTKIQSDLRRTDLWLDVIYCGAMSALGMLPVAAILLVAMGVV